MRSEPRFQARWTLLTASVWAIASLVVAADSATPPGPEAKDSRPPGAARRITLDEALERARGSSPRLGALAALHTAAEANLDQAEASHWPELDLSAGYTRYSDVPELTFAAPGAPPQVIFPNIPDGYRSRASASVPLYTGGRLTALESAARGESVAAQEDQRAGSLDVTLETTAAFWTLLTSRASARVLDEALASFERHAADARDREQVGLASSSEVLAVEVERDRAVLERIQATNLADVANADLARVTGLGPGLELDPVPPETFPDGATTELEMLVKEALATRPERKALAERADAAQERIRAERAGYFPQATFAGGYDYARPNRRILPAKDEWEDSWDVGVNVSLDVFDFGRTRAAVGRARAQADAATRQLEDLDLRIRQEVTARYLNFASARSGVPVAERALASAAESKRVSGDRYRDGVAPSSELLDAEVAHTRAGLDLTRAIAAVHLAAASLARALGR